MAQRVQFVIKLRDRCGDLAGLCRQFGISRKTGYKWWARFRAGGIKALEDKPRRPRRHPQGYKRFWVERLRTLRLEEPRWGPKKLRRVLQRTHRRCRVFPAVSTLARWLRELGLVRPRKKRARRGPIIAAPALWVARAANEVWTVDFKGWFRTGEGRRCEPLTVRDLHSRFVLGISLLDNQSDAAARAVFVRLFGRYGLPKVIRVDNGAPFGGSGALGLSRLSVWWLRLGILVEFIRRGHPQDNGAHEQMHRILKADTAAPPAASVGAQKRRTQRWVDYYNQQRPHEALGQEVPATLYHKSRRKMPPQLADALYARGCALRRVRPHGDIKWRGRLRFVGRAFVGELLGLKEIESGVHEVYLADRLIGVLHERDKTGMRPAWVKPRP
jgi:putative transposase